MAIITTAVAILLVLVLIADLFALYHYTVNRDAQARLLSIDNHLGAVERYLASINEKAGAGGGPVSERVASSVSDRAAIR